MKLRSPVGLVAGAFLATLLSGCGGGGGGDPTGDAARITQAAAEGVYRGHLNGSTSHDFQLLVLENDELWSIYGDDTPGRFVVRGFLQGAGLSHLGFFSADDTRDFGTTPTVLGRFGASYQLHGMLVGGFTWPTGSVSYAGNAVDPSNPTADYDTPATLSDIAGSWSLTGPDGAVTAVTIDATGAVQASSPGCTSSGAIAARASGKNVFDVSVTMGASPCASPGATFRGIALSYLLPGSATRQLIVTAVDANRTSGLAFFGTH